MSNKSEIDIRRQEILNFITRYPYATQEEVVDHLSQKDIYSSQATIVRDLKNLGYKKVNHAYEKIKTLQMSDNKAILKKLASTQFKVSTSTKKISEILIQTERGLENAIADVLYKMYRNDVIGIVTGYGCIIIFPKGTRESTEIRNYLTTTFPSF